MNDDPTALAVVMFGDFFSGKLLNHGEEFVFAIKVLRRIGELRKKFGPESCNYSSCRV